MTASPRVEALALAGATVLCLVPFLGKPLHLDDPLFYWAARHIAGDPLDPYGFGVNWYLKVEPMAAITKNPPGASYLMALAGLVAGWSAVALHAAFMVPAVGVVLGTWALARRFAVPSLLAGALVLAAPGFLVSATTLMSDVPMLALWLAALVLWVDGIERDRPGRLLAAGLVAAACVLTKYPGAGVLPLMALHAVLRRGVGKALLALVPPLVLVGLYQWWTAQAYGQALLSEAVGYAREEAPARSLHGGLVALAFLGGTALPAGLVLGLADRRVGVAAAGLGALAAAALLAGGGTWWTAAADVEGWGALALHFAVFVAAGAAVVVAAGADAWRRRDGATVVLACWVAGIVVFVAWVNWMANVRSALPAVPAAALLAARAAGGVRRAALAAVAGGVVLGLWIARGDAELARAQVAMAERVRIGTLGRRGTTWFQGHWGFQPAMEAIGARPFDVDTTLIMPGDVVVVPRNNTNVIPLPTGMRLRHEPVVLPLGGGGTTVAGPRGVGFYSSLWGPLPYRVDPPPPERFDVYEVLPEEPAAGVR